MPIGDKNKTTRADRQAARVDKYSQGIQAERKEAGVDDIDIGASASARKAQIDEVAAKGVKGDTLAGLKKIQDLRSAPDTQPPKLPDQKEATIKDVRKQRRAKIADILGAFSDGYRGKKIDPTRFQDGLKDKRQEQYEQYKTTSKAAKQRVAEWEAGYVDEQLKYLDSRTQDPLTSEKEKIQIDQLKADLLWKKNRAEQAGVKLKEAKTPKEDSATYRYTNKDGETITTQMPGQGETLRDYAEKDKTKRGELKPIEEKLEATRKQLEEVSYGEGAGNQALKKALGEQLRVLQEEKDKISKGTKSEEAQPKTEEEDLWGM